jgi:DNA ligase D-like protein (predicted ligase)
MPTGIKTVELDLPLEHGALGPIRPMFPMPAVEAFDSPAHVFEVAWDGVRVLAHKDEEGFRLWGRSRDITHQYPEIHQLDELMPPRTVLDGELIVSDEQGRPDRLALQEREHANRREIIERARGRHPVTYVVYDILYLEGRPLFKERLQLRQQKLRSVLRTLGRIYVPEPVPKEGLAFFEAARERGLEGVVAKRLDSPYRPGQRHPDWLLIEAVRREDFAVLAFKPGEGRNLIETLIVGSFDGRHYTPVGRVVGGFEPTDAMRLRRSLDNLASSHPIDSRWNEDGLCWVEPAIAIRVKFSEWDTNGKLRFPIFAGLRPEVSPEECVRTPVVEPQLGGSRPQSLIHFPRLPL